MSATATCPRTPKSTPCARVTAETDATAGPQADDAANAVTSVDQRAVNVDVRLCRLLGCHISLGGKASWGKGPRPTSSWLPTYRISG
ncbi:MAG: hypothetical protein M1826_006557 [Phylliscum demangeonii]|nr:MAG: hypothetical protein M1826_006557 [Phylliscum demangeonii]